MFSSMEDDSSDCVAALSSMWDPCGCGRCRSMMNTVAPGPKNYGGSITITWEELEDAQMMMIDKVSTDLFKEMRR